MNVINAITRSSKGNTPLAANSGGQKEAPTKSIQYVLVEKSEEPTEEPGEETKGSVAVSAAGPQAPSGEGLPLLRAAGLAGSIGVPALNSTMSLRHTFRWSCGLSGAGGTACTWSDLFYAYCAQISATTARPLISSLRLRKITIYYGNAASTLANSGMFRFDWNYLHSGGKAITKFPRSLGALGCKLVAIPPKQSVIGFWHTQQDDAIQPTDVVFYVQADSTSGSVSPALSWIIDIDMEFTLVDGNHGDTLSTSTTQTNNTGFGTQGTLAGSGTGYYSNPWGYQKGP